MKDLDAAFEAVFSEHFPTIHRYLARRVGTTLADDLAAETFVIALRRWETNSPERAPVIGWLLGIATRIAGTAVCALIALFLYLLLIAHPMVDTTINHFVGAQRLNSYSCATPFETLTGLKSNASVGSPGMTVGISCEAAVDQRGVDLLLIGLAAIASACGLLYFRTAESWAGTGLTRDESRRDPFRSEDW